MILAAEGTMHQEKLRSPRGSSPGSGLRKWRDELVQGELLPILMQIEQITLGERGERIVGHVLDGLENEGYMAIHSVQIGGRDIDHVLVGPAGVFVVETKFRSGTGLITFRNGQGMFVGERRRWPGAIKQAKSGAREVSRIVREECGLAEGVWPVVVFVGNWQVADQWESTDARVFMPGSLRDYIGEQQPVLKRDEIELIASHLERSATRF
ncbi:MAG: NERD domain-containing protein [Acidobacteriota bacterium]|nr:NERD domain-containing protein [Acidobacteriota bacterium]